MSYEDIPTIPKVELYLTDTFEIWRNKFNQAVFAISDSVDVIIATIAQIPQPETVAERYHASESTEYGLSTDTLYGHAKASSTTPLPSAAQASVGTETSGFARGDHVHPHSQYSATTAKLETARSIDGIMFDGTSNTSRALSCTTAAGTVAKTITKTGFSLQTGAFLFVVFSITNTASNPTLNVNGTGAKPIYISSELSTHKAEPYSLLANKEYLFVYNGSAWVVVNASMFCPNITSDSFYNNNFNNLTIPGEYYIVTTTSTSNAPLSVASGWWVRVKTAYTTSGLQVIQEARMHNTSASTASSGPANLLVRCYNGNSWGTWEYNYAQFAN